MKKLIPINKFKEGAQIQGFYLCVEKNIKHTKSGELFIDLELKDITGRISGKIWSNVSQLNKKFESGNAVVISGHIEEYLERLQLVIKKINKATVQYYGRYGFDPAKIVTASKKNPQKMYNNIIQLIRELRNQQLQKLIMMIYKDERKKILIHPASVKLSFNFRSGFLEHVLNMTQIVKKIAHLYSVDKELVMAGILLIKIGVLRGIKSGYDNNYTEEGNLVGNAVLSRDIFIESANKIKNFPLHLKIKLEHIILSHENNFNSIKPYRPSFPEALLVHFIHKLDFNMELMEQIISEDVKDSEFTVPQNYFNLPILKK